MKKNTVVKIDASQIKSWDDFHSYFAKVLGFPDFYGRNMNAWIDCMTSIDLPDDGLSTVHAPLGGFVVLQLEHVDEFARNQREIYDALIECAAFVNWRRIELGEEAVLSLSFDKTPLSNAFIGGRLLI